MLQQLAETVFYTPKEAHQAGGTAVHTGTTAVVAKSLRSIAFLEVQVSITHI